MSDHAKSRHVPFEVPEFHSTIPNHLLGKLSDSERYMVETMSKLESQSQWLVNVAVGSNRDQADLDGRIQDIESWKQQTGKRVDALEPVVKESQDKVTKLWDWHQMLSGKWAVLWALILIVIPLLLKFVLDLLTKKGP